MLKFVSLFNALAVEFQLSNFWRPAYINSWDRYLTSFWVPLALILVFLICLVSAINKKAIGLIILYVVIIMGLVFYIGTGNESAIVNAVEGVVSH